MELKELHRRSDELFDIIDTTDDQIRNGSLTSDEKIEVYDVQIKALKEMTDIRKIIKSR